MMKTLNSICMGVAIAATIILLSALVIGIWDNYKPIYGNIALTSLVLLVASFLTKVGTDRI